MSADIFAPTLIADVMTAARWDYKPLFDWLSKRFDYIVRFSESGPARWSVSIWNDPDRAPHPSELGIDGDLGLLGWTTEDVSLETACALVREASGALASRSANFVVVFHPGDWWRRQAHHVRAEESRKAGGAP